MLDCRTTAIEHSPEADHLVAFAYGESSTRGETRIVDVRVINELKGNCVLNTRLQRIPLSDEGDTQIGLRKRPPICTKDRRTS
jgi:hypothetical protein